VTALIERSGYATTPPTRPSRFSAMVVVAHPGLRRALVARLRSLGARDVVEAASVGEARARAHADGPRELCVVDGTLPDGSGVGLLRELRTRGWGRGVVLSPTDDPYSVRAALASGVRGFVVAGDVTAEDPVPPPNAPAGTRLRGLLPGGPDGLSNREIEVLQLVSDGNSNREIGEALGLSALTVKSHLARIARKLGTGDRAEMVAVSMRAGLVH
jgi:DNA-binding NarL/FixJ family response regulator